MKVEIDTDTPVDSAMAVLQPNKLLFQHGGAATKIVFDKVTVEPVADLLHRGIQQSNSRLTMIRMDHDERMHIIAPDSAITYEGCRFEDLPLDSVMENIRTKEDKTFVPDIPFPIIAYVQSIRDDNKRITVSLPNHEFDFVDPRLGIDEPIHLYMPPLWFGVEANGDMVAKLRVAVVTEYNGKTFDTSLKKLPLPNIYGDGHICTGSSKISGQIGDNDTDGARIANSMTRFFNSNWNSDLCSGNQGVADEAALEKLKTANRPVYDVLREALRKVDGPYADVLKCVASFARPTGWLDLHYASLGQSTKEFLGCDSR